MELERLVHSVEARLVNLGRRLIQADERSEAAEESDHVRADITNREMQLTEAQGELERRRQRLEANQGAAALMPSVIESSMQRNKTAQALRQALELERLRKEITVDTGDIPRLEQVIWSLEFTLRQLRRRLGELQDRAKSR